MYHQQDTYTKRTLQLASAVRTIHVLMIWFQSAVTTSHNTLLMPPTQSCTYFSLLPMLPKPVHNVLYQGCLKLTSNAAKPVHNDPIPRLPQADFQCCKILYTIFLCQGCLKLTSNAAKPVHNDPIPRLPQADFQCCIVTLSA